jgi:hypothetical protein
MHEEDLIAFSKVKSKEMIIAALNKLKSKKMKTRYLRSLGMSLEQLKKGHEIHLKEKTRDEEAIAKVLDKMRFGSFLDNWEAKNQNLNCLETLMARFRSKETNYDNALRLQVNPS